MEKYREEVVLCPKPGGNETRREKLIENQRKPKNNLVSK